VLEVAGPVVSGHRKFPPADPVRVMAAAVALGRARLGDGESAVTVLEDLWRGGFATGVRSEQDRAERLPEAMGRVLAGQPGGRPLQSYWTWGAHHDLTSGTVFRYGGCAADKPTADREAVVLPYPPRKGGRLAMRLGDTGEQALIPVLFWAALAKQEGGSDGVADV
jgi:hypothetical protein